MSFAAYDERIVVGRKPFLPELYVANLRLPRGPSFSLLGRDAEADDSGCAVCLRSIHAPLQYLGGSLGRASNVGAADWRAFPERRGLAPVMNRARGPSTRFDRTEPVFLLAVQ